MPKKLTDIAPGAIGRSGGTDDGTAPHGAKPKPPPLPARHHYLKLAERLSDAGEGAKALAVLEEARRKYAKNESAVRWIKRRKALLLLKTEGLEGARELAMEVLDSPITDLAKSDLRWEVIAKMLDAGDVDGLAGLLPDCYIYAESMSRHRQIVEIAKRHGLTSDPAEPVAIGEAASSQTVLSERLMSYSVPPKARYPKTIMQALAGYKPVCRSPEVKLHTLTNCTAIFLGPHKFFFDADGGFIRECSDPLPAFLNERIKDLLKDYPPPPPGGGTYLEFQPLSATVSAAAITAIGCWTGCLDFHCANTQARSKISSTILLGCGMTSWRKAWRSSGIRTEP